MTWVKIQEGARPSESPGFPQGRGEVGLAALRGHFVRLARCPGSPTRSSRHAAPVGGGFIFRLPFRTGEVRAASLTKEGFSGVRALTRRALEKP